MIVYNVTVKLEHPIADEWLEWLRKEHIPDIINTGCFTHATILRLLDQEEDNTVTYAIQYHATDLLKYNDYIEHFANAMRKKATEKWRDQFISFRTVMEVVN
jgi:hypothetical protein